MKSIVDEEDDDLLKISCKSSLLASLEYQPPSGANFKTQLIAEDEIRDFVWGVINEKHFMDSYLKFNLIPRLRGMLSSALKSDQKIVSIEIPVGKVFFADTMILNTKQEPYATDPFILTELLNTHRKQIKRWSRRTGKSHFMKIDLLHYSVLDAPCYSLYMCQSWDVSKEHLRIVETWLDNNPLLYKWSGGEPSGRLKMQWSDSDKYLVNKSHISCRTATQPKKLAGKGINRLYEDEKALYPMSAATEELGIMTKGQPLDEAAKFVHIIASAPAGHGTLFEKLCYDPQMAQVCDLTELPVCGDITFNARGKPTFHDIVTPRLSQQDLLEEWYDLKRDRFMEQFMLHTLTIGDRAIPEDIINSFFDRNMPIKWSSDLPCIVSYDLGKSEAHRSIIHIYEVLETGHVFLIRIIKFKPEHPFRSRVVRKAMITGVIDTIPELAQNYNIQWIIGDATGMGAEEPIMDLAKLMKDGNVPIAPANIIPYKWSGISEQFMGKAPLWFNLTLPRIQQGWIRSIYDEDFHSEMRTWTATQSSSGKTVLLKPAKQTLRDDHITTMMQAAFVAFRGKSIRASPTRRTDAVTTSRGHKRVKVGQRHGEKGFGTEKQPSRRHRVRPRWREKDRYD